jgi:hypothetical protein
MGEFGAVHRLVRARTIHHSASAFGTEVPGEPGSEDAVRARRAGVPS